MVITVITKAYEEARGYTKSAKQMDESDEMRKRSQVWPKLSKKRSYQVIKPSTRFLCDL